MIFNNPEVRKEFIELYGKDVEGSKFKIGENIVFYNQINSKPYFHEGKIQAIQLFENKLWYLIDELEILTEEHELTKKVQHG